MKHFARIAAVLLIGLSVSACTWQTFKDDVAGGWNVISGGTSPVQLTPGAAVIARNAFDAAENSASVYLEKCHADPAQVLCTNKAAIEKVLVPAIRAGRKARNSVTAFMKANPDTTIPQTLYSQLIAATAAIKDVLKNYNIGG